MPSMCRSLVLVSFLVAGPLHAATPAPQQTPDAYAQPGQRVSIAPGRTLNLRCSGKGPRTAGRPALIDCSPLLVRAVGASSPMVRCMWEVIQV